MSRKKKIITIAALALLFVGTLGFGYLSWQLTGERNQLAVDLADERQRFKLLQHKYAEQKALTASVQRAKLGVEGQLVQARQEMAAAIEAKEAALREMAGMEKKYEKKTAHLEARVQKYTERIERLLEIQEKYKTKLGEAVQVARERHTRIMKLEEENSDLTAGLQETTSGLRRCEGHNVRLSKLAEELVNAYLDKGVGASLAQAEPFTKLKQVELEKIVQEYLDRIDKDNMQLGGPANQ